MNKEYFEFVSPTYIENWTPKLYSLSIPQIDIPLSLIEAHRLWDAIDGKEDISDIALKIQTALNKLPNGAFVRLGSRSPKDSLYGANHGFRVFTSREALSLLLGDSERIMEDLLLAEDNHYAPHIWVRQWVDIPKWAEFRCFMRDKQLVGISQYYYKDGIFPDILINKDSIIWSINEFVKEFISIIHLDNVVFDVYLKIRKSGNEAEWQVKLIEINPFFELTDPCLFNWHNPQDFNGEFRFNS